MAENRGYSNIYSEKQEPVFSYGGNPPQYGGQQHTTVIVQQPAPSSNPLLWAPDNAGFMPPATIRPPNCPPGLENLALLDEVFIKQYIDVTEACLGCDFKNRYSVQNMNGQVLLVAAEESELCMRLCCSFFRGFTMYIMDQNGVNQIILTRPFKCCAGCCWCSSPGNCCSLEITVECPPGNVVGTIRQERYACSPYFGIYDASERFMSAIRGPCCPCICPCFTLDYKVSDDRAGKDEKGQIQHVWGGFIHDCCTNADNYKLTFPQGASVYTKALIIGASILLDFIYFENKGYNSN